MSRIRKRSEEIRQFILDNVEEYPKDIAAVAGGNFGISRQAINKHIHCLIDQNALTTSGSTRNRTYSLKAQEKWTKKYPLNGDVEEFEVWRLDVEPQLKDLPDNVMEIWEYGFTEMFNNAIDHSSGSSITVHLNKTAVSTEIWLYDDGEGIFRKIQREMDLSDERHAVLELSKGKLTTDPENHTGEGIFFSSRAFDSFHVLSGGVAFSHEYDELEDWILERAQSVSGTGVFMKIRNNTARVLKQVFDSYTSGDDYGFTKTVVPVRLAQYDNEKLVSRSQAKRLLARVDRFKIVIFDFEGIDAVGQAFADEVFRVFNNRNPDMEIEHVNASGDVVNMIQRAKSHQANQ